MNSWSVSTAEAVKRSIENAIELFDDLFLDVAPINFYNEPDKGHGVKLAVRSLSEKQCLVANELSGHLINARQIIHLSEDDDVLAPPTSRFGMGFFSATLPAPSLTSPDPEMMAMEKKMSMLRDYLVNELVRSERVEQALKTKEDELVEITAQCEKLKKKIAAMTASGATVGAVDGFFNSAHSAVNAAVAAVCNPAGYGDSQPRTFVNAFVRKQFGKNHFFGVVAAYDARSRYFQIVYEDADNEDLTLSELRRVLWSGSTPVAKQELCLKHARLFGLISDDHFKSPADSDRLSATSGSTTSSSGSLNAVSDIGGGTSEYLRDTAVPSETVEQSDRSKRQPSKALGSNIHYVTAVLVSVFALVVAVVLWGAPRPRDCTCD